VINSIESENSLAAEPGAGIRLDLAGININTAERALVIYLNLIGALRAAGQIGIFPRHGYRRTGNAIIRFGYRYIGSCRRRSGNRYCGAFNIGAVVTGTAQCIRICPYLNERPG